MRSVWKLPKYENFFFRKSFLVRFSNFEYVLKLWTKRYLIFFDLLNRKVNIYNGSKFISLLIKRDMFNKVLGQFILTKRITSEIHSKTNRNKRGKMQRKKR